MTSSKLPISVLTTDTRLIVQSWDSRMVDMTGMSAETACGQPLAALVPDLEKRGLLTRFQRVLSEGAVETLSPIFHQYLIPCPPFTPSQYFEQMQQRVTIAPIWENEKVVGVLIMIEDVTPRLERERDLADQLTNPDEQIRREAATALGKIAEIGNYSSQPLVKALKDESWQVRQAVADSLALRIDPETTVALLRSLREQHRNLSLLNSVLQVLAISNVDAVPALIDFLSDPDTDLRIYAALALGQQRSPRAIPALLRALTDPEVNVRYHTIEALGQLRAVEAADALTETAASGNFFLGFPSLSALVRIGDPSIAPRLVPLLNNELLANSAAEAIRVLGDDAVVRPLAELLNESDTALGAIVTSIAAVHDRYQAAYGEGAHIADLTRNTLTTTGVEHLLQAVTQAGPGEIRAVALILSWLQGTAVEQAMVSLLSNPNVRPLAATALVRYGLRVGELLVAQLEAEDTETRKAAVQVLGSIGDTRSVPALVTLLKAEPDLTVAAATALAKIGDHRAFEGLLSLLGHPDAAVRQAAIAALDSLGHPALADRTVTLLSDPNPLVRESAVKIAGYFAFPQCIGLLFECCHDPEERVRRAAIEHLLYLDEELPGRSAVGKHRSFSILTAALFEETPKVRATAARALGQIESDQAFPYLLKALRDEDAWVRYHAAQALGKLGLQKQSAHEREVASHFQTPFEALAQLAQTDPVNPVRAAAAEALGRLGGDRAVPILSLLVEVDDGGGDVARAALTALGQIDHASALPPLLRALNSPNPDRRTDSVRALGERGDSAAVDALQWIAASDSDARVVQVAIDALFRIAEAAMRLTSYRRHPSRMAFASAIAALLELTIDPSRRGPCCIALIQLGEGQVEALLGEVQPLGEIARGLNHIYPEVRSATIQVLARLKNPLASELLMVALDDRDSKVRLVATVALGYLGNRSCEAKLTALARNDPDPAVRRAAQKALHHST